MQEKNYWTTRNYYFSDQEPLNSTTCSLDVHAMGMNNQSVLSYTFYGDETYDTLGRKYFEGVSRNLEAMKLHYPQHFRSENRLNYRADTSHQILIFRGRLKMIILLN